MDPLIPASLLRPSAQASLARLGKPARKSVTPSWLIDPDDDRLVGGTMLAHTKQYRIESCIGEGGMGWVYKAWDPVLERPVALKVMKPDVPASPTLAGLRQGRDEVLERALALIRGQ